MVIFYDKQNGEIIASFPECYGLDEKIVVTKENRPASDFIKHIIGPEDSYDFDNPRHPANIHDHIVVRDQQGEVVGLQRIRPSKNPRKDPTYKPLKPFSFED